MKQKIFSLLIIVIFSVACSEDWLKPEPLSTYNPESTLIYKEGMEGVIVIINKYYRVEYSSGDRQNLLGEWNYSDMTIFGPPVNDTPQNLKLQMTPTSSDDSEVSGYWGRAWKAIGYANVIISRIDDVVDFASDAEKNAILSKAYFCRAYWYYRLVFQFGDVPLSLEEITTPKLDFYTYSSETILEKITEDLEFAVEWLPAEVEPGDVNAAAGSFLLTKCYLALRDFDKAIAEATKVIDDPAYALMTERFGTTEPEFADFTILEQDSFDVMWDLHQKYNKSLAENTEKILVVQDAYGSEGEGGGAKMRDTGPTWWHSGTIDPDGARGATDNDYDTGLMYIKQLGRGVGRLMPSQYFRDMRWEDPNDLRYSHNNYFGMERYLYNNPSSNYYGQPYDADYIRDERSWYPFMYNKLFYINDAGDKKPAYAWSDMYVYRLAELYLLRAEAYWWNDDIPNATKDVNTVRARAKASLKETVDIDYIFDERARELFYETPRKCELTRVAYIMAQLGRDGYSMDNMHENNWFYDRVMHRNNYYADEIVLGNTCRMLPYHVYWPIKQDVIDANTQGHINQAMGYPGAETNIDPLTEIPE